MAKIFYLCLGKGVPTGGTKIIHRHVEILCELGFDAYVLRQGEGLRSDLIRYKPRVISRDEMVLSTGDLVVLPEDAGVGLCSFARGVRKVLFNQNAYYSFRGFADLEGPLPPYLDPEFEAALVVSEDNRRYLEYAFPGVRCRRIRLSLDLELFSWVGPSQKKSHLAFMTRKNAADVTQVLQILRSRNALRDWKLTPIENQDEAGVARLLGEARIFLAFGHPEGISLSNLEALARGCRVIGYSGMGCREYFSDGRCREIPVGDVIAFAQAVEEEIALLDAGFPPLEARIEAASRQVRELLQPRAGTGRSPGLLQRLSGAVALKPARSLRLPGPPRSRSSARRIRARRRS